MLDNTAGSPPASCGFPLFSTPIYDLYDTLRLMVALISPSELPPDVALALGISPTSSSWQGLAGAAIAYGLIDGGVAANIMKLTPLGKK